MFQLPNISTLHLSDNGLTGTLPSDITISESLRDLALSHNDLTGVIPDNFQLNGWVNLDLSYNRLTGTLQSQFSLSYSPSNSSLFLEQNRISGAVPETVVDVNSISLLDSNVFSCKLDHSDLPVNDPEESKYQCGSDSLNISLYVWLAVLSFITLGIWVMWHWRNEIENYIGISYAIHCLGIWWSFPEQKSMHVESESNAVDISAKLVNFKRVCDIFSMCAS